VTPVVTPGPGTWRKQGHVEVGPTTQIFSNPQEEQTEYHITGRLS